MIDEPDAPRAAPARGADLVARLIETERQLGGLVSALPGIAFRREVTVDGTIRYPWFSASVERILGVPPQDMAVNADGCLHVVHWADRAAYLDAVRQSAADGTPCAEEFRAVTAAGDVRWLQGTAHPRPGPAGTVVWDGVWMDVTDGRRAEFHLEMLMEHAADTIVMLDTFGAITMVNAAAQKLFGYAEEELLGQPLARLVPDLAPLRSEDRPPFVIDDALAPIVGDGPRELTGRRKDGGTFPFEISTETVRLGGQRLFLGIGRDITARRRTERALRETEQRLRRITANIPGVVFQRVLHPDGRLSYGFVSESCRDILGVEPAEVVARPELFLRTLSEAERQGFMDRLAQAARTLDPFDEEMAVVAPDGRRRWLRGQSRPTLHDNGDVAWDGVLLDVSDRKLAEQRLSFLAYFDPLTRLPNRAALVDHFTEFRTAARRHKTMVAVLSVGIDRFGIINATMGHKVGDQVLMAAADLLQAAIGRDGLMARASGDRFLILLGGLITRRDAQDAAERVHAAAQTRVTVTGEQFDLSSCTGIAVFPRDGDDIELLSRNADAALQRAKGQGGGTMQFFSKDMASKAVRLLSLQSRLRRAIDREEFIPYFQPQVDLSTGQVVGMEALVRWLTPEGIVAPGEFIPVAEESGLIDAICAIMLRASARQNKAWQDRGLPAIPVAVNISGRQFQYANRLFGMLESVLTETGLEPRWLELELTESSAMRDADNAIVIIQRLRDMGVNCAIDDFGTGYSSLSVLKRFPIQKLKIDRSFVMDIVSDPNDSAIVDAIIAMAKALRLTTVAEGVEHRAHLEFLRRRGCDQMQGYFFSRPLAAERMGELLADGRTLHLGERPSPTVS